MEDHTIVDRLYKRDAKRVELLQQQHKLKDDINASDEQLEYFCTLFKEKSDHIDSALSISDTLQLNELSLHFDNIRTDLKDLQKYVAASSLFLKDFNIRKSQEIIQALQTRSTELQDFYFPKKKFGFSKKKTIKKQDDMKSFHSKDSVDSHSNKKSYNIVTCGFTNKNDEKLSLDGVSVFKKDVSLSFLSNCVVTIRGSPGTLHLDNLTNCIVLCGPVSTSVFLDKCNNCKMALACQQLRCHSSSTCDIYLHVTSKAIVEDCDNIRVAPYNFKYVNLDEDFASSSLDLHSNNWNKLDDFNWLASDAASPNWKVLNEDLRITVWDSYI